ncbi:MAG: TRAP transporter small permease [Hyphomicrobiales bacterium]
MATGALDRRIISIRRLAGRVELAAAALMAAVTVLTFVSAFMRYVAQQPIPDAFDLGRLTLGIAIFWGAAGVNFRGSHISVDLLYLALPAAVRKAINILSSFIVAATFVMLAWTMGWKAHEVFQTAEHTYDLSIVVWPFYFAAVAGCWLSAAMAVLRLVVAFVADDLDVAVEPRAAAAAD